VQPTTVINTFNILDSGFNSVSAQSEKITQQTKDGNSFTYDSGVPVADPIYAGYTNYPGDLIYYYGELMDGGVSSLSPPTIARDYSNNGSLSAVFTLDTRLALSSNLVVNYDGGNFTDVYEEYQDDTYTENIPRSNIIYDTGITAMSMLTGDDTYKAQAYKEHLQGKIFAKTGGSSQSRSLSDALSSTFSKYSSAVKTEIYNSPKDLEIFYNTICIETPSYLVFDKIVYENSMYIEPSTSNTVYSIASASPLNVFSQRFFNEKEKTVSFCKIIPAIIDSNGQLVTNVNDIYLINSNNKMFIPYIYQHSITDNTTKQLFPTNTEVSQLSGLFTISDEFDSEFNFNPVRIKKPILTYNSLNDVYKLVYLLIDNNNHFHLIDYTFEITSDQLVSFLDRKWYKHTNMARTTDFINTNFAIVGGSTNAGTISGTEVII